MLESTVSSEAIAEALSTVDVQTLFPPMGTVTLLPLLALERLLVALLVGALIGLDRERSEARKPHQVFAGVRTFPLIALAGAIPMLVIDLTGPALLVVSFLAVTVVALISYFRTSATGDVGATTEMAAVATFLLGVLAGAGHLVVAGAAGVAIAVLLAAKPRIEAFYRALTSEELAATLELAVISVIILPLLPNRGYGPWEVLNPYDIWLIVVLVSALSFAGFVATRLLGDQRGLSIAAVVGALVSSTAVTMAMAERSRTDSALATTAAAATVLASVVMGVRVAVLAAIVNVGILPRLLPVVGAMIGIGLVAAWVLARSAAPSSPGSTGTTLSNPFSLTGAVSFAAMYALVLLLTQAGQEYFGTSGRYVTAALAAIADVDAVTIALTRSGASLGQWQTPAALVTTALVVNTVVKLGIASVVGGKRFRWQVASALAGMALVGALVGVLVFIRF